LLQKKIKFVEHLAPWVKGALVTRHDCEVVIGTLNHCSLIIPDGRSQLPSLYRLSGSFRDKYYMAKHRISDSVASDVAWWISVLSSENCQMFITLLGDPSPLQIHVDASTSWGIGFVMNGKWLAWKLKPGWKIKGREIGWA